MPKDVDRQLAEARAATELLTDVVFREACDAVEQEATEKWRKSRTGETAIREGAYYTLVALDKIKDQLRITRDAGNVAQSRIDTQAIHDRMRRQ